MCEVACPWTYCIFVGETEHERLDSSHYVFSFLFSSYYDFVCVIVKLSSFTKRSLCDCATFKTQGDCFVVCLLWLLCSR